MSNESKQSSPIGDVEQAAETQFFLTNADPFYNGRLSKPDYMAGFKDGSQWASPRPIIEELVAICKKYANDNPAEDMAIERAEKWLEEPTGENLCVPNGYGDLAHEMLPNETPAHPTAVNGGDESRMKLARKLIPKNRQGSYEDWVKNICDGLEFYGEWQKRGEAIEFAEWIRDAKYVQANRNPDKWYLFPYTEESHFFTTTELYQIFSGKAAAPNPTAVNGDDAYVKKLEKQIVDLHDAFVEQFDLAQKFMLLDCEKEQEMFDFVEWVEGKYIRNQKTGYWHTYEDYPYREGGKEIIALTTQQLYNNYPKRQPKAAAPKADDGEQHQYTNGEWARSETPANPTAVNVDEDRGCPCKYLDEPCHPRCTCVNGASSTGCMFCATYGSLEQRKAAAERIAEKLRPKAAAPVKSKEEILEDYYAGTNPNTTNAILKAMEEYANQFKEKTFSLQDMLDYGKWMRDQLFKYEDGVPEVDYLKEKHGIDLNMIQ